MKLSRGLERHGFALAVIGVLLVILGSGWVDFNHPLPIWTEYQTRILDGPYPVSMYSAPQFRVNITAGTYINVTVKVSHLSSAYFDLADIYLYNSSGYQAYEKMVKQNGECAPWYCGHDYKAKTNATETIFISQGDTYYFGFGGSAGSYISGDPAPTGAFVVFGQVPLHIDIDPQTAGFIVGTAGVIIGFVGGVPAWSRRQRTKTSSMG